MKICTACKQQKRETEFNRRALADDGLQPWCRECQSVARQKYRAGHREKEIAYARQYRKDHPLNAGAKAQRAELWQNWYGKNRDARADYQREYRNERREEFRNSDRGRYKRDPHVSARRLIQRMVSDGRLPRALDRHCVDCGGQAEEYDHYLGYEGEARKMVEPVCRDCHQVRTNNLDSRKQIA